MRRCDENCVPPVNRQTALVLVAYCKSSREEVEHRLCPGRVHWELHALSLQTSSKRLKELPPPQNWTDFADGGATLRVTSDLFPDTDGYVTYEIKASGQLARFGVAHCYVTVTLRTRLSGREWSKK